MVLRERIELSTSPLPMECSTTELPQQCGRVYGMRAGEAQGAIVSFADAVGKAGQGLRP